LALWWLLPESLGLTFAHLLPIYLACLGVALASSTPGGVGPFELTLLFALQGTNVNELLAGLIAFRLVYFAVPACIAVSVLIRPARSDHMRLAPAPEADHSDLDLALRNLHPESGVARQENHQILYSNLTPIGIVARTCQASICMFQPNASFKDSWQALAQYCKSTTTFGLLYKCNARTALDARSQGFSVARIALDAQLQLTAFSLDTPSRRSLRRKLRKAEKAGIHCTEIFDHDMNIAAMRAIDARWQQSHGTARGFSMGRFSPSYLTTQRVFGAWHDDTLVAYISCHSSGRAWALDLVRYIDDMPDGTMHTLLTCAITAAKSEGFHDFSLASVPCSDAPVHQFIARWSPRHTAQPPGLTQFKQSFAPNWIPLYAVARTRLALLVALWDIWQEVIDPAPLPVDAPNLRPHNRSAAAQFVPPIEAEYPKRRSQSL
jgi:phosphatidylglycerol lysyltransferase